MHSELRERLRDASGESRFVVAVNIDIRGFSSFFSDSSQAAAYLSSAYTEILDNYFEGLDFFKPTGDGLLLVREVDRQNLEDVVNAYVSDALELDGNFSNICLDDDLINFPTPDRVGIGVARGTATRLAGGGKVLDFSGYPLNLASRLMDLARPHGVVFDGSIGTHLLDAELFQKFSSEAIYVKGLADLTPITAHVSNDVIIPDSNRSPIGAEAHAEKEITISFSKFKKLGKSFLHRLTHTPSSRSSVKLHLTFPKFDDEGRRVPGVLSTRSVSPIQFVDRPEGLCASFDYGSIIHSLTKLGVSGQSNVTVQVTYSVPIGTAASLALSAQSIEPAIELEPGNEAGS